MTDSINSDLEDQIWSVTIKLLLSTYLKLSITCGIKETIEEYFHYIQNFLIEYFKDILVISSAVWVNLLHEGLVFIAGAIF